MWDVLVDCMLTPNKDNQNCKLVYSAKQEVLDIILGIAELSTIHRVVLLVLHHAMAEKVYLLRTIEIRALLLRKTMMCIVYQLIDFSLDNSNLGTICVCKGLQCRHLKTVSCSGTW